MQIRLESYSGCLSACAFLVLSACSSEQTNLSEAPDLLSGVFLDSAVQGLSYTTPTQSGLTSATGAFNYMPGESVTFSLGDLVLPSTVAKPVLTPIDIFADAPEADTSVVNLARLLQTLDVDGNSSNGIVIDARAVASASMIVFSDPEFDQSVINLVANSGSVQTTLIDSGAAIVHLNATLQAMGLPEFDSQQLTETECSSSHPLVGSSAEFETFFHEVTGRATIIDDCTISVTEFGYDGLGPQVYFYAALDGRYSGEDAFILGERLDGQSYSNASIDLKIPSGKSLDDLNGLSVWCADFDVDFGSLSFTNTR
ncbi:MAG: DM13 domain-containing protein [Granulosicoccus sp.]|nr:DM13 domain-containing protein [Granulosicoccus sp.]